jgi:hypothetical protein
LRRGRRLGAGVFPAAVVVVVVVRADDEVR